MQRIRANLPTAPLPRFGCQASHREDRSAHLLTWDGWWQSGNPEVVLPRWRCVCGARFVDAPNAQWFRDDQLGGLFHERIDA